MGPFPYWNRPSNQGVTKRWRKPESATFPARNGPKFHINPTILFNTTVAYEPKFKNLLCLLPFEIFMMVFNRLSTTDRIMLCLSCKYIATQFMHAVDWDFRWNKWCTAYSFMASLGPYVFPARFGHVYCSSCWIWRSSEASFPCCWSCGEPTSAWILVHAPKPAAPKLVPFSIISAVQSSGPTVQVQPGSSYGYGSQPIYQVISPVSANWMFGGNNNNNNAVNGTYPALPSNIALNGTIPPRIAPPNPHAVTHAHRTIYTSAIRSTIPSSTTTASQAYRINAETFPLTFGPARLYHPRSNLTDPLPTRSASCLPTPTPSNSTSTPGLSSSTSSPTTNNSNNTQTPPSPSNSKPPKRYQVQFIDWPTLVEREGKLQAVQFLVRIMARALGNGLVERAEEGGWEVVFE